MSNHPDLSTPEGIAEAEAMCAKATEGPWSCRTDLGEPWERDIYAGSPNVSITEPNGFKRRDDAKFCAHARTGYPAALAEIRRLRKALENELRLIGFTDSGRTHYTGCESVHPGCAAAVRIRAVLAPSAPKKEDGNE